MWITAWILVASSAVNQPNLPPFADRAACESARQVFIRNRAESVASCVAVEVFVVHELKAR